jgi:DNA-binding transcriptional LysR family regulator
MDRLEAMAVFAAVAELRGFAPAARRLGLSPSAVTRLVAGLEEHLGARLLQRTTRSVTLTDAGSRFLERCRRILADVAEAEGAAQAERTLPTGRFVLTAPVTFGARHVAPVVSAYLARHPDVTVDLQLTDRVVSLVEDGVDAAVRIGTLEEASLIARRVGETRRVLVAAPKYLSRRKKLRAPEDLSGHALIQQTGITPTADWRFLRDGKELALPVSPRLVTNSVDAAIGHAERGGGLTMVLAYQVQDAVRAGRLVVVLAEYERPALPIHVVYPSTRLLSAKVRAFVELVTTSCDWRFVEVGASVAPSPRAR